MSLPTIMDISARASSLADRPQWAMWVTSVRTRREDHPPFRLILSQTSAGNGVRCVIDKSSFKLFLCLCLAAIAWSRPAHADAPRARAVKAGRHAGLAFRSLLPGHALTGPSTARWSSWSGRHLIRLDALEGAPLVENCPGDASEFVRERNRQHAVVQPLSCGLDPRFEPIAVPMLRPDLDQ